MARKVYAVLALAVGVPTLAAGTLFSLTALALGGATALGVDSSGAVAMLSAGVGGLAGLVSWTFLSLRYWHEGGSGLRRARPIAWLGLAAGCAAAGWYVVTAWPDYAKYAGEGYAVLWWTAVLPFGPALIPLACYLAAAAIWPARRTAMPATG